LKISIHKLIKFFGFLITAASVVYLVFIVISEWKQISLLPEQFNVPLFAIPGALLYGLTFILMGTAWHYMLSRLDDNITFKQSYWIFSRAQIGKYLPGNLFHYAGRQLIGKASGIKQNYLLTVNTGEIFFQVMASAAVSIAGFAVIPLKTEYSLILTISTVAFILLIIVILFASRFSRWLSMLSPRLESLACIRQVGSLGFFIYPMVIYTLHLLLIGTLICIATFLTLHSELSFEQLLKFAFYYTVAWTLGFFTPGAPGGIGVREALLTAQLSPIYGYPYAVTLSLSLRFSAVIGDIILFLTSFFFPDPRNREL